MTTLVWAGGLLRAEDDPIVAAGDHGWTVGDGVFETLEVKGGRAFALRRHLKRLAYSAARMGMAEIDEDAVREAVGEVLAAGTGLRRLRITVSSGTGPAPLKRGGGPHTIVVTASDSAPPTSCHAVRVPWRRNERSAIAGVKTTSYAENVVIMEFARSRGADEAILANTHGHLCEGATSNILIERGGEILTPPLASGCLPGITRGLALEWGAEEGIPIRAAAPGELEMSVLDEVVAGDAFAAVTSSTRRIQPLASLDRTTLEHGPLLARLSAVFEARAGLDADPGPRQPKQPL
ncbi:aminotransferase class IV [Demequina mangrovi]|uniref:Branched-chain amino acid aminotransferase n=1 Tax=Demequina mangrovi TaxID=1043493 RepID=A0A1H6UHM3_9MICO|nr:aminotransferase class IV [Demequina mangrovi]SEI87660.1 branched-chain amino acid aminotransferase [Demequina mangrovi]